jgi:hypothetical protein
MPKIKELRVKERATQKIIVNVDVLGYSKKEVNKEWDELDKEYPSETHIVWLVEEKY